MKRASHYKFIKPLSQNMSCQEDGEKKCSKPQIIEHTMHVTVSFAHPSKELFDVQKDRQSLTLHPDVDSQGSVNKNHHIS